MHLLALAAPIVMLVAGLAGAVPARAGQAAGVATVAAEPGAPLPFEAWLAGVRTEALERGIRPEVVEEALAHLEPLPVVVERDRTQAEKVLSVDAYVRRRLTPTFVRTAREMAQRHRALLKRVSAAYDVPAPMVVALWGLESNYGRFSGVRPTVAALATLAYDARRAAFFRGQLFDALEILNRGDIELARLKGSWAGAMGQVQFMPSSYLAFAQDFDDDGRRDIWSSEADVFASIANYLKAHGWAAKEGWGREVKLSAAARTRVHDAVSMKTGGCSALHDLTEARPVAAWRDLGVRLADGQPLPALPETSLLLTGSHGYLLSGNYDVILSYNCAHAYALSAVQLADRIRRR